jgi:hypothetical protein
MTIIILNVHNIRKIRALSAGLEPTIQRPKRCVISISPREQGLYNTSNWLKYKGILELKGEKYS